MAPHGRDKSEVKMCCKILPCRLGTAISASMCVKIPCHSHSHSTPRRAGLSLCELYIHLNNLSYFAQFILRLFFYHFMCRS